MEYFTLVSTSGYFTYDFLSMAWFGLLDLDMTIHHCLCVIGIGITLNLGLGANEVIAGLWCAELSNAAMHMRILLKHLGMRYARSYEVAEFWYFISFFIGRFCIAPFKVFNTVTCPPVNILAKIVCIGIMVQSCQFLYRMYFIFMRRLEEIKERNEKKIKFHWFTAIS